MKDEKEGSSGGYSLEEEVIRSPRGEGGMPTDTPPSLCYSRATAKHGLAMGQKQVWWHSEEREGIQGRQKMLVLRSLLVSDFRRWRLN